MHLKITTTFNNSLYEKDIIALIDFIKSIKKDIDTIYAFGTSIFRKLGEEALLEFADKLKKELNVIFKVVSADEESYYTTLGVINNINYNKNMAVVIGGGGSTEIAIIDNKEIIHKINLDFGAMDITNRFLELKEDTVKTDFNTILNYTLDLIEDLEYTADILVLAGGDYIYFYEKAGYKMNENNIYKDVNQPFLLSFNKANEYDMDVLNKSLDKIKEQNPDNISWWDGVRGMRFCMNAVARKLNSKFIIPTRINMLIGLIEEIKNNNIK